MEEYKKEDFVIKEEAENAEDTLIERQNITSTFSLKGIHAEVKHLDKVHQEVNGTVRLAKATIRNIEENHPFLTELTDEQLHHAWMLFENKTVLKEGEPKLVEIENQQEAYKQVEEFCHELVGYVPAPVEEVKEEKNGEEDG